MEEQKKDIKDKRVYILDELTGNIKKITIKEYMYLMYKFYEDIDKEKHFSPKEYLHQFLLIYYEGLCDEQTLTSRKKNDGSFVRKDRILNVDKIMPCELKNEFNRNRYEIINNKEYDSDYRFILAHCDPHEVWKEQIDYYIKTGIIKESDISKFKGQQKITRQGLNKMIYLLDERNGNVKKVTVNEYICKRLDPFWLNANCIELIFSDLFLGGSLTQSDKTTREDYQEQVINADNITFKEMYKEVCQVRWDILDNLIEKKGAASCYLHDYSIRDFWDACNSAYGKWVWERKYEEKERKEAEENGHIESDS